VPPFYLAAIAMSDAGGRGRLKNAATVFSDGLLQFCLRMRLSDDSPPAFERIIRPLLSLLNICRQTV